MTHVKVYTLNNTQVHHGTLAGTISKEGEQPQQPLHTLALSNVPRVVVVKLNSMESKYMWGVLSQTKEDTVLTWRPSHSVEKMAKKEAKEWTQHAFKEDCSKKQKSCICVCTEVPTEVPKEDIGLHHEMAGLQANALVNSATYPDAPTHYCANELKFHNNAMQSIFWYNVPCKRHALVSQRLLAYSLMDLQGEFQPCA